MKKMVACLISLVVVFSFSVSLADIDISSLSYEELVDLVNEAQMLMMQSDKWQEVEVPSGIYMVGKDIPEGSWTITASANSLINLTIGSELSEDKLRVKGAYSQNLFGVDTSYYAEGKTYFVSVELTEGQYVGISGGNVIFTPQTGNSFSFR